ncbi:MAG: DHH family phosphoesterase [Candidatus Asgardarchaeia archaeon]
MKNKLNENALSVLRAFIKDKIVKIISDGDLDGIFATGFLVMYLRSSGLEVEYFYPEPEKIRGLVVQDSILVELPLTKGLTYKGKNLLFDHHNGPARVELFNESNVVKRIVFPDCRSVAQLVREALGIGVDNELLEAVNDIDSGVYRTKIAKDLHKAYLLNISSKEMREFLTEAVANEEWSKISKWASEESKKWKYVEDKVSDIIKNVNIIIPRVAVFTYYEQNDIERAARTEAMLKLEDQYDIVVSIGLNDKHQAISARIATKRDIDLSGVYQQLRGLGYTAGGRKNVGGVQFNNENLDNILKVLKKIRWPISNSDPSFDVIYAEPSLNIFYPDTFYLLPDAMREIDYIGVIKITDSKNNNDYLLYTLEEVSKSGEESKNIVDLVTGMRPIFWYKGQQRKLDGIPCLSNLKILYSETKNKAENIKPSFIKALEIDAEIHNLIYYALFFLSKENTEKVLDDIKNSYGACQVSEPIDIFSKFLANKAEMFLNMFFKKAEKEIIIPDISKIDPNIQWDDIFTIIAEDLKLRKEDELSILFLVQSIGKETIAYKERVNHQKNCIQNIVEKLKDKARIKVFLVSNNRINEQVERIKEILKEDLNIPIDVIDEEVLKKGKFERIREGKVVVIILSDYKKDSIFAILKTLSSTSCLVVVPESRIEPKNTKSIGKHQKKLLYPEHKYFEGALYENRVLYISMSELIKLKAIR